LSVALFLYKKFMVFTGLAALFNKHGFRLTLLVAFLIVLGVAVFSTLHHLLSQLSYNDLVHALVAQSSVHLALAIGATIISYLFMTAYDKSALHYAGVTLKNSTTLLTSFIAFALGNTVGFGALAGGAVRLRLYSAAGLEPAQVTKVIGFNVVSFSLGIVTFGAAGLLWGAQSVAHKTGFSANMLQIMSLLVLMVVVSFFLMCAVRRSVMLWRWRIALPDFNMALVQLGIAAGDMFFAALTLWVLLPAGSMTFPSFIALYMMALALGVISHVPGGLGVFEVVMLMGIGHHVPVDQVAGALLLYRCIYFILPLALATLLLAHYTWRSGTMLHLANAARPFIRAATQLTPVLLAVFTFIAGLILLLSGVTPTTEEAAELLAMHVPLVLIESSHMIGSICGLLMLVLARGLMHRLDAAWWGAMIATGFSFWVALPKGIAWHEMILLGFLFILLMMSRRHFNRRSSLFVQILDPYWFISVFAALGAISWILFFSYRNVAYTQQLWWRFEVDADAPRSLRAMLAVAVITLLIALWQLMRRPAGDPPLPSSDDLARAEQIIQAQQVAGAGLALSGDKHLLFSESGKSFIMYGKMGRSWVGLFDPVGVQSEWRDLIWEFIEMVHAHGGRAAFYQVRPETLPLYIDAGLSAFKLGEAAWVNLANFHLKGGSRANLRTAVNRAEREGMTFEIIPREQVYDMLPQLRKISDAWITAQKTREKGYSLGVFDTHYLMRFPLALVRLKGQPIAFASLLETAHRRESTIDLMRHGGDVPSGTMDYLFIQLMQYYQALGYERFGLGMAPLSGMAEHELASRWHRFGRLLFGHGERFYHFRGLRSFKEKFSPDWEPRYLAAPGGLATVLTLADVTSMINRAKPGMAKK
jgi:phosphatidylglycerol lysyltransferase